MGKGHILVDLKRIEDIEKNGGGGGVSTDTKDETITLSLENWILNESNNTYSQTVAVDGMTATSNPIVLLSGAADDPTDDEEESYACISSITTADDSITFVVDKMPKVSFNVIIKNVVNAEGGNDDVAELEGRVDALETEIDSKVDTTDSRLSDARTPLEHNHDDKYYTESEIDSKFNTTNQNVTNNANAISQLNSDIALTEQTLGYECKNLIPYPYYSTSYVSTNGITWTDNGDGTVTANGTATDNSYFVLANWESANMVLNIGDYILTGCPNGGSTTTYAIGSADHNNSNFIMDFGSGNTIKMTNKNHRGVYIIIAKGATVNNVTFKPMLRRAEITDDTYELYKPSVDTRITSLGSDLDNQDIIATVDMPYVSPSAPNVIEGVNWQNYRLLLLEISHYNNVQASIIVTNKYFRDTTNNKRPFLWVDAEANIAVWQNGNGSIIVSPNNLMQSYSDYKFRMWGLL